MSAEASADTWLDRSVFVTGSTGLAGGWLAGRLSQLGAKVTCLVRERGPDSSLLGTEVPPTLVFGDVRDQALIERILGDHEVEVVFHLAAQASVPTANRDPAETLDTNIRGTWTVLEACRKSPGVKAAIVASSDKAYGTQPKLPYREDMPLAPTNPYDVSKGAADLIARCYATTYELPVAVTRAGNFFGGGDLNWTRIVPGTLRSALSGTRPVIRSDGTPLRDYVYVEDAVEGFLLLAEALLEGRLHGSAVNLSYERPVSVSELVVAVLEAVGSDLSPLIESTATHEIQDQYLDATIARTELGWTPRFDFDEGLRRTVAWYRSYLNTATPAA